MLQYHESTLQSVTVMSVIAGSCRWSDSTTQPCYCCCWCCYY